MDLQNDEGVACLRHSLVTGADLLAQYAYMGLGFKLVVMTILQDIRRKPTRAVAVIYWY